MIGFGLLIVIVACLGVVAWVAIYSGGRGDVGNGFRYVILPTPSTRLMRVAAFIVLALAWSVAVAELYPALSSAARLVLSKLLPMTGAPSQIALSYASNVDPLLFYLAGGMLFIFLLTKCHTWYSIVVGIGLYLLFPIGTAAVGGLALDVSAWLRMPTEVAYYIFDVSVLFVAFIVMLAIVFSTSFLPKKFRYESTVDNFVSSTYLIVVGSIVVVGGGAFFRLLSSWFEIGNPSSGLIVFLTLPALFFVFDAVMLLIRPKAKPVAVGGARPNIDVIMPAFNEEAGIERTVRAIDRAARRYGGQVTLYVADDGSSDDTVAILNFVAASADSLRVVVLHGNHGGKGVALNRALEATTSEIVVRIDADIIIDQEAFVPLPGWFANPVVGCVGAFDLPNFELPAWYTKGRLFECISTFGFSRLAYERFDANNIPGTFMAFRREEALLLGGFVQGMNGEDSDLTFNLGRIGLESVIDRSIVIYEDVPQTFGALIEQRTRWSRASFHLASRHLPASSYDLTPRYLIMLRFVYDKLAALIRPVTYVSALVFFVLVPRGGSTLSVVILLLIVFVPEYLLIAGALIYYGYGSYIKWMWLWLPFTIVRKIGLLSGLFSLPDYQPGYDVTSGLGVATNAGAPNED